MVQVPIVHAGIRPTVVWRPHGDPLVEIVGHRRPLIWGLVLKMVAAAVKGWVKRSFWTICAGKGDENNECER